MAKANNEATKPFHQNENPTLPKTFFSSISKGALYCVQMAKANNADRNHFLPSSSPHHHLNFERFRNLVNRAFYTRLQKTLRSTINLVL